MTVARAAFSQRSGGRDDEQRHAGVDGDGYQVQHDELKRDASLGCGDELRDDTALDPRTPSSRLENGHAMVVSKIRRH